MSIANLNTDPFEAPHSLLMPFCDIFLSEILLFVRLDGIQWHFVMSAFLVFEYLSIFRSFGFLFHILSALTVWRCCFQVGKQHLRPLLAICYLPLLPETLNFSVSSVLLLKTQCILWVW